MCVRVLGGGVILSRMCQQNNVEMFSFDSRASREILIMKHHKGKFEFVERETERGYAKMP